MRRLRLRLPERARGQARNLRGGLVVLAIGVVAGVVVAGGSASSTAIKPFTAEFGHSVAGGASHADVTLTINNLSSNQSLGSANVTAAKNGSVSFQITGVTGASVDATQKYPASVLQLRNLNIAPGGSLTVHIFVDTPCAGGDYTWGISAKQSNSFNGPPGNDFTLQSSGPDLTTTVSGSCKLQFVTQPASAAVNAVITDTAYNPTVTGGAGSPKYVAVEAVDGSGNPITSARGTVTLTKVAGSGGSFASADTTSSFDANGVATFSTLKSSATGSDLQLKASATGFSDSDASTPAFDVTTGGTDCTAHPTSCSGTVNLSGGPLTFTGTGNFDFIAIDDATLVPASVTASTGGCANFKGTGTGFEESDTRNADSSLDFVYYIKNTALKKAYGPNYGQPDVPLCGGGKVVDLTSHEPVDCTTDGSQAPWRGRHLGADHKFDGTYQDAVCGEGGYWWGILGTKLDPIDPNLNPTITGWGSTSDGVYRTFTIHVPPGWDWRTN
jgi:hypothetical protein